MAETTQIDCDVTQCDYRRCLFDIGEEAVTDVCTYLDDSEVGSLVDVDVYCDNIHRSPDGVTLYTRVSSGDNDALVCCKDVCKLDENDTTPYPTCSKEDYAFLTRDEFCDQSCDNSSFDTPLNVDTCTTELCGTCKTDTTTCTETDCDFLACNAKDDLFDRCEKTDDFT